MGEQINGVTPLGRMPEAVCSDLPFCLPSAVLSGESSCLVFFVAPTPSVALGAMTQALEGLYRRERSPGTQTPAQQCVGPVSEL